MNGCCQVMVLELWISSSEAYDFRWGGARFLEGNALLLLLVSFNDHFPHFHTLRFLPWDTVLTAIMDVASRFSHVRSSFSFSFSTGGFAALPSMLSFLDSYLGVLSYMPDSSIHLCPCLVMDTLSLF